jgi:predicted dehydrogenase
MEKPRLLWDGQDYDPNKAYLDEMEEFIRYVEEGRIRHEHDAASSIGSMQILDALFESVSSGKPARIHANDKASFF